MPTDIFSDLEKQKLSAFSKDEVMKEAVRKVLLAGIYYNGTLTAGKPADAFRNFMLQGVFTADVRGEHVSDEMLGQEARADARAIRLIEQAYKQISSFEEQPTPEPKPKTNRGK
jgi:hypothetical protein